MSLDGVLIVVIAVGLVAAAVMLVRSRRVSPWPAIVTGTVASGICFTIGGSSGRDASEPSIATVVGAIVGLICVAAAVLSLVRRPERTPLSRMPTLMAATATVIGAVGLIVHLVAG